MAVCVERAGMKRRDVLAVAAAFLPGCAKLPSAVSDDRTAAPPPPAETVRREVTVERQSTGNLTDVDIQPSVSVVQPEVTAERTARIRFSLTNDGDERRVLRRTTCPPADAHESDRATDGATLVLLLANEQDFEPQTEDCWRPRPVDFFLGMPCSPTELALDAGETVTREYEVWDYPKNERCMPPGTYRFGDGYSLDDAAYEWEFSVSVTDP